MIFFKEFRSLFEVVGFWVASIDRPQKSDQLLLFIAAFGVSLCWARLGSLIDASKDANELIKNCHDSLEWCHGVLEDIAAKRD
jgi:hypothetical protein